LKATVCTLFLLLHFWVSGAQQNYEILGNVKDTVNYSPTQYTSISLINAKDSVLLGYTRTDESGGFRLPANKPGDYILLISHPSFAEYTETVKVTGPVTDLGSFFLFSKTHLLNEVAIYDRHAITVKGDTTEYAADSFKVRAFANVDELLRKLPGIEVDRKGNIRAQGENVKKMLVDGDEFFTDDPAVVAQMLRASAVDKVQVFNKKTNQAEFTGIDDGKKIKTINLVLKEDAKQGYFGKVQAGGGLPDYFDNALVANSFKKKRKIALFGNTNNVSSSGGSDYSTSGATADASQRSSEGLPKNWAAGVHYDNKWFANDAFGIAGDLRTSKNNVENNSQSQTKYILPDTQYLSRQNSTGFSSNIRHSLNMSSEIKLDSTTTLKINVNAGKSKAIQNSTNYSETVTLSEQKINSQLQEQKNTSDASNAVTDIFYGKRLGKPGRTISLNLRNDYNTGTSTGFVNSLNKYGLSAGDTLNQKKLANSKKNTTMLKAAYTQPLNKSVFLEFNYEFNFSSNTSQQLSYDLPAGDNNPDGVLNKAYSSDYKLNILMNTAGGNFKINKKKFNFTAGVAVAQTDYKQQDYLGTRNLKQSYFNFFPSAMLQLRPGSAKNIMINYNGQSSQPSLEQIQPLVQNTDPLNISIGNPNLKQEFRHMFGLNYNSYRIKNGSYTFGNANFSLTQNAITQTETVDSVGRRVYQYTNIGGNYNGGAYMGYGYKIKPLNLSSNIRAGGSYTHNSNFINQQLNVNTAQNYSLDLSFNYVKDTLLDISYAIASTYNINNSSIRQDISNNFWSMQQQLDAAITLPFDIRISTSALWQLRPKIDENDKNNSLIKWNAAISKSFLKDRSLVAAFSVNDILNQNVGFTRSAINNYITDRTFLTVRRYFMLSLTWNFTHSRSLEDKKGDPQ
jgi:hypothetical protein